MKKVRNTEKVTRHCREVICPFCNHQFMWMDMSEGLCRHRYRMKESKEYLKVADCPQCSSKVVMLPNILVGVIPEKDDRIEIVGEYRI